MGPALPGQFIPVTDDQGKGLMQIDTIFTLLMSLKGLNNPGLNRFDHVLRQ